MLQLLKKASIYLEIFLKSLEFFDKKPYITSKKLQSIGDVFKKPCRFCKSHRFLFEASISLKMSSKSLFITIKASHFSENVFKKNRNLKKSLKFSDNIFKIPRIHKTKAPHSQKRA
jgi:hypothetical protein